MNDGVNSNSFSEETMRIVRSSEIWKGCAGNVVNNKYKELYVFAALEKEGVPQPAPAFEGQAAQNSKD